MDRTKPVAEDVALFQPRLGIEGMQIFPAGGLAGQRRQVKARLQAVGPFWNTGIGFSGAKRTRARARAGGPGSDCAGWLGFFPTSLAGPVALWIFPGIARLIR